MVTKSKSNESESQSKNNNGRSPESLFNWGSGNTGVIVGAAMAGAAVGIAANVGRKLLVQLTSGASGDWMEALKTEHQMTLAIFDKIEATDDSQTMVRTHLLGKLKYALTKHALQEENVIYPALRQANSAYDADHLEEDHGYVKTYLYELETMAKDSGEWLARVRDFRQMIQTHMKEEEEEIFPKFRELMTPDQNSRITAMMHKEGFKFA
jgi:hemerythrin superfamily protein